MGRKRFSFILVFLFTMLMTTIVSAKELDTKYDVALDHKFKITLSQYVDSDSIEGNITVYQNRRSIPLSFEIDGKILIVTADELYEPGRNYLLTVHEGLMSRNGVPLKESVTLPFETIDEEFVEEDDYNGPLLRNEYGLDWKVRDLDYTNLELYSEENGQVVAEYSTRENYKKHGVKVGDTMNEALQIIKETPSDKILTADRKQAYRIHRPGEGLFYDFGNEYVVYHYDKHKNNVINSIYSVNKDMHNRTTMGYGQPSDALRKGFEDVTILLINQSRLAEGLEPLTRRDDITFVARAHSQDMIDNNFFAHKNLQGFNAHDRVRNAGFMDLGTAENIFMEPKNAIFAHEGFMNSLGHRENLLKPTHDYTSVGIAFKSDFKPYYTIMFHRQW